MEKTNTTLMFEGHFVMENAHKSSGEWAGAQGRRLRLHVF
jgi:hypothetical protein